MTGPGWVEPLPPQPHRNSYRVVASREIAFAAIAQPPEPEPTLEVTCTRCQRQLPAWRYHRVLGHRSTDPVEPAQPCKDCRAAKVAASLVTVALKICERARLGSAVMLLADTLDVLNDPDEVSQNDPDEVSKAGRDSPSPPQRDRPKGGHGG
ncbi:MAG: hypothetical protein ACRDZO_01590 [Egibacteraceae bacterium]